jgi:hypothetical protein
MAADPRLRWYPAAMLERLPGLVRLALPVFALALAAGCLSAPPHTTLRALPGACLAAQKATDGRDDYEAHRLTAEERALVKRCLENLPAAHRAALGRSITAIGFVYFLDGEGRFCTVGGRRYLLFNPQLLRVTASDWLSLQATRCFAPGDPWLEIAVDCGDTPALQYALLHMAARLANGAARGAAPSEADRLCAPPVAAGLSAPIEEAPMAYRALAATPQVSLRATTDAGSDAAEFVAFRHLTEALGRPYRVTIRHGFPESRVLFSYEPMKTSAVVRRLRELESTVSPEAPVHDAARP